MSLERAIPDGEERDRATKERNRNVIVAAGAGTGKTSLIVSRLLELVAPAQNADAIPLERIAAITFTRKAAGELRLRIRQRILELLADKTVQGLRQRRLFAALAAIDTAHIGTVHSFADRLLKQFPVEGRLTPGYEIAEDNSALIREAYTTLVHAVETGTLGDFMNARVSEELIHEASESLTIAQRAGIRPQSLETDFWTYHGLDNFVAALIESRDVDISLPEPVPFDRRTFDRFAAEYCELTRSLTGDSRGTRWLRHNAVLLERLGSESDPASLFAELVERLTRGPNGRRSNKPTKGDEFGGDDAAWDAWKAFDGDTRKVPVRSSPLRDDLIAPLQRWLATRLVRMRPVVLQLYETIKARDCAVDQIDLLLKLRNLVRDDKAVRAKCQALFDHIFVDEFQDTDPLQAELLLFLCEQGAVAARATDVRLASGKLTVVGDPKQSIYRFRRADVAMYAQVSELIRRGPHHFAELKVNFRTTPRLIDWINERFDRVLGVGRDDVTFDPQTGVVFNRQLTAARGGTQERPVHVLPFTLTTTDRADDYRRLEARCVARYLRWLVERSGIKVVDRFTAEQRDVQYNDVAILAFVTTNVPMLFEELRRFSIPHVGRGGTLFLQDPLHRQFLLGLRALADREDGVAEAALLRPPFFSVDLQDLLAERAGAEGEGAARAHAAREVVRELRRRRFERGVGSTARALLEQTALARVVALGANGSQRLDWLRHLCLVLEGIAVDRCLDFDSVTAMARDWVAEPVALDPPFPSGDNAVRISTVHQAKGLEFPVVILWDGRGSWDERVPTTPWQVERNGRGWAMRLDRLEWEEPPGAGLADREKAYRLSERKRLAYVAATRARDLLVVPKAGTPTLRMVCGDLLSGSDAAARVFAPHVDDQIPEWAVGIDPVVVAGAVGPSELEHELNVRWAAVSADAARARSRPIAVSEAVNYDARDSHVGRYGAVFGETVHRAIGVALRDPRISISDAVGHAAMVTGLSQHIREAVDDLTRALEALERIGLRHRPGADLQLEYPISAAGDGCLMLGVIDLLAVKDGEVTLIDFKTDVAPSAEVTTQYQKYVNQLQTYASMLAAGGLVASKRGLLFTQDGVIRWL